MNIFNQSTKMLGLRNLVKPIKAVNSLQSKLPSVAIRNLWTSMEPRAGASLAATQHKKLLQSKSTFTSGICLSHSKAEQELVEFLTEEILEERKAQKAKNIPTEIEGFKVSLNGAEVTLEKKFEDETITIHFNVNHTVDSDQNEDDVQVNKEEVVELKSKPNFDIDLIRGESTVSLQCSFISEGNQEDGYNDIFGIDEISIYNGDWSESVYSVAGEVIDTYLYDLMMNYLDAKGITNDFVEKMGNLSTAYEHAAYIGLLEGLSKFVSKK